MPRFSSPPFASHLVLVGDKSKEKGETMKLDEQLVHNPLPLIPLSLPDVMTRGRGG